MKVNEGGPLAGAATRAYEESLLGGDRAPITKALREIMAAEPSLRADLVKRRLIERGVDLSPLIRKPLSDKPLSRAAAQFAANADACAEQIALMREHIAMMARS